MKINVDVQLGSATLSPTTPTVAGKFGTWTIVYTVGKYGIDSGGQVKIARRLVSDWGKPQFDKPAEEGYTTVVTDGPAKIGVSWQPRGYIRPKTPSIVLDIYDGSLRPGDTITVVMGDTSHGSPGIRAQTYLESAFEFFVLVDPTNSCDPRPITDRLTLAVVADELESLVCLLPSQAPVGEAVDIFVKGEDRWRNPTLAPAGLEFEWVGTGNVSVTNGRLTAHTPASGHLLVRSGSHICRSNPITINAAALTLNRYWGDLHAQTAETVGVGSEDEYFTFGRDWSRLDFMSHQGNDFQMSDEFWQQLNETTKRYHENGRFVVFPGYEWSASSPTGGDHNVFYRREGHPILRYSHWLIPYVPASDLSPAHPADQFYAKLKQAVPLEEVIVCQHVGGRYANLVDYFDQDLIRLVEVVSVWGVFEWMLWDAFDKGYIVGVMGNSDGHHGRPGAEGAGMAEFGIANGLTCVLAEELSREAIFTALKNRRCYATTGPRMLLDFTANGHPMGTIISNPTGELTLTASVTGEAPLESLQLFCGKEVIAEAQPTAFDQLTQSNQIRVSWQGSRERGRQRRATWDGAVRVEGCQIVAAEPFSMDVIMDGIVSQTATEVAFASKTTGDRDGLDLVLDDASKGVIVFESAAGKTAVNLTTLTDTNPRQTFDYGGVDMQLIIERYSAQVTTRMLQLNKTVTPPVGQRTPYFVKATQVDGQMAWASPVWVDN
ncbi:MAG: DUF3604 domain-containing protein [Chloroflexota bacterium]